MFNLLINCMSTQVFRYFNGQRASLLSFARSLELLFVIPKVFFFGFDVVDIYIGLIYSYFCNIYFKLLL